MSEYNSKPDHEKANLVSDSKQRHVESDSKLDHRNDVKSAPETKTFTMPTASAPITLPKLPPQDHQQQIPSHSNQQEIQSHSNQQEIPVPYFTYQPQSLPGGHSTLTSMENDVSNFFGKWWFYILKIIVLIVAIFIGLTIIPNDVMSMSKKFGIGLLSVVIYGLIDLIFSFLGNHKGDMCKVTCGC